MCKRKLTNEIEKYKNDLLDRKNTIKSVVDKVTTFVFSSSIVFFC